MNDLTNAIAACRALLIPEHSHIGQRSIDYNRGVKAAIEAIEQVAATVVAQASRNET